MELTAEQLQAELNELELPSDVPHPRSVMRTLPDSYAKFVLEGAIAGRSEQAIVPPPAAGGANFEITTLLTNLASIATLYCAVLQTYELLTKSGSKPKADEVVRRLPPEHRKKMIATAVAISALQRINRTRD